MGGRKGSKSHKVGQSKAAAVMVFPPFLFLGPCSAASSSSFLQSNEITSVISIGSTPSGKIDGVTYHRISMVDSPSAPIPESIESASNIIDQVAEAGGKVLVHCSAGISRSPTVIAGYLMSRQGLSLKAALAAIVSARPTVCPNTGFIGQLRSLDQGLHGHDSLGVDELPRRTEDRLALLAKVEEETGG